MKKIIFLLFLIIGFSNHLHSQNCKNYRNGKFKLHDSELDVTYIIERKGNLQTERKVGEDKVIDFEIKWIDDCTYIVSPSKKTAEFLKSDFKLIVEIKNINGDFLELEMYMENTPKAKLTTIMEVIN